MSPNPRSPLTEIAARLKVVFRRIGYTTSGVADLLGPDYTSAMYAGQPAAVRHRLRALPASPLTLAIAAFILRDPVDVDTFADVVGTEVLDMLIDAHAADMDRDAQLVRLLIDIRPHLIAGRNQWVFSDADASMSDHVPGPDHVLGVGAASLSLLQATPTSPTGRVLDLGTGSGVQILGQVGLSSEIIGTDVHPRALEFAQATLVDTDAHATLKEGSWFDPVAGEKFDRIIANPPFVVGPPQIAHVYRDSGMDLDGATRLVVKQSCEHLSPGGTAHLLGAWIHSTEQSWQQRVADWLPDAGFAAWIIERDCVSPAQYVATWLKDESLDLRGVEASQRTQQWLDHFEEAGVRGVGFGFIAVQRLPISESTIASDILAESMTQYFEDPLGPEVEEYFARVAWLRDQTRESILSAHYRVRPLVALEDISVADAEEGMGFKSMTQRITRMDGPRWSHEIDSALATIISGLNPNGLPLDDILELYAMAKGIEDQTLHNETIAAVVDLVRHGILLPAELLEGNGPAAEVPAR